MEDWQLDFEWLRIRHFVKDTMHLNQLPDFNQTMVLVGIQELGQLQEEFTKDEKECLLHIATCKLLSKDGYYVFDRVDEDGWPHWKELKTFSGSDEEKEKYLTQMAIEYFDTIINSN